MLKVPINVLYIKQHINGEHMTFQTPGKPHSKYLAHMMIVSTKNARN